MYSHEEHVDDLLDVAHDLIGLPSFPKRAPTDRSHLAGTTLWGVTECNPVLRGNGKHR